MNYDEYCSNLFNENQIEKSIAKHDSELLDKVAEKLKAKYPLYFNGLGMNVTDILHKELHKDIDEVIAELKAEVEK